MPPIIGIMIAAYCCDYQSIVLQWFDGFLVKNALTIAASNALIIAAIKKATIKSLCFKPLRHNASLVAVTIALIKKALCCN